VPRAQQRHLPAHGACYAQAPCACALSVSSVLCLLVLALIAALWPCLLLEGKLEEPPLLTASFVVWLAELFGKPQSASCGKMMQRELKACRCWALVDCAKHRLQNAHTYKLTGGQRFHSHGRGYSTEKEGTGRCAVS